MIVDAYASTQQFRTALELAWVLRVASEVGPHAGSATHRLAEDVVLGEHMSWLARAEAARFLATSGALTRLRWRRLWEAAPIAFKPSLIEAAALSEGDHSWPRQALEVAKSDFLFETIVRRVRSRS